MFSNRILVVLRSGFSHTIKIPDERKVDIIFDQLFQANGTYTERDDRNKVTLRLDVAEVVFARRLIEGESFGPYKARPQNSAGPMPTPAPVPVMDDKVKALEESLAQKTS